MSLKPIATVAIIDGPHAYAASRALGWDIDYAKLRDWLDEQTDLIRPYYYSAIPENREVHNPVIGLTKWLSMNGYYVQTKPAREWTDDETGRRRLRAEIVAEMSVGMMEAAEFAHQVFLFSGHGDMTAACESVQRRKGVRVVVCSTLKSPEPMAAETLRAQADLWIDLADLKDQIGKPLQVKHTPHR